MLIFNKPEESTSKCPTEIYSRRVDQVKKITLILVCTSYKAIECCRENIFLFASPWFL